MDTNDVRGVSHSVYGNRYLLEVAAAIAEIGDRPTTQKELALLTRIERNLVAQVVKRLEGADLLRRVGEEGRERPLSPRTSVFWQLAAAHLEELREQ